MRFVLGVDEAGRGPLAGPVAVGVVKVPETFVIAREFPTLADSKQMTPRAREKLYWLMLTRKRNGDIDFCVRFTGPARIDAWGMTRAVRSAVFRGVRALSPGPKDVRVFLDGLLKAPEEYKQQTIIGGDEAVPAIALASIAAKVSRDRLMRRAAKLFPEYGFEIHKGYGTKKHRNAIKKYGPCEIHRHTFIHLT
jgi:ribonuclease HII